MIESECWVFPISQNSLHYSLFQRTRTAAGCSLTRKKWSPGMESSFFKIQFVWRPKGPTMSVELGWGPKRPNTIAIQSTDWRLSESEVKQLMVVVSYFINTIIISHILTHAITKSITEEIIFYSFFHVTIVYQMSP